MLHIETCCCGASIELKVGEARYGSFREEVDEVRQIRSEWRAIHSKCKPKE